MNYYIQGDAANAEQIKAAFERLGYTWGRRVFYARFPEHYNDFYYTLHGDYDLIFDKIIEQIENKK